MISIKACKNALMGKRFRIMSALLFRGSHTDIKFPDYSKDLRKSVSDPNAPAKMSEDSRKSAAYATSAALFAVTMYGLKAHMLHYVLYMSASADVLAMAKIEINLSDIGEDQHKTFKWRGKPLFVWHRTEQQVKDVRSIPVNTLRDPQADEDRVKDPNWLVVVGVCTHLGCVPIPHQGDFGGYYCPCHGSHFDISGRARKGPAPSNLVVPSYNISGDLLTVG